MQVPQTGPSNEDVKADLNLLFDLLKGDQQQGSQRETIDKSTLLALLLYLDVQKEQSEFFAYVKRTLEKIQKQEISKTDFLNIFLEPQIDFKSLSNDEMTQIFKIFDREQKGSFSADDFLSFYKQSPEYNKLDAQKRNEQDKKIRDDFEKISAQREITPIEFYKIVNMSNQ